MKSILLISFFLGLQAHAKNSGKETAVQRLGIAVFKSDNNLGSRIQSGLYSELRKKSFLKVKKISQVVDPKTSKKEVKSLTRSRGVDAVLYGQVRGRQLRMLISSGVNGRPLVKWVLPMPKKMNRKGRKLVVQEAVDAVVQAIPYRGIVGKSKGSVVKLELGNTDDMKKGQVLQIFEFEGKNPNFSSPQRFLGEVELLKVNRRGALAKRTRGEKIPVNAKVSFTNSFKSNLSALYHNGEKTWASVGFDVFSIETDFGDKPLASRAYDLSFSPFLNLSFGIKNWLVEAIYGQAESNLNSVQMAFISWQYSLFAWGNPRNGYLLAVGGTVRQFKAEKKSTSEDALGDAQGLHPYADFRWTIVPKDRTKIFVGGRLLFPLFEEGGDTTTALTSLGFGAYAGTRIDLTDDFGLEIGVRAQRASLSLKGNFDFTESQAAMYTRGLMFF